MEEKIILDMLAQDSVSVKKQQYTTIDGIEYLIKEPYRKAYVNSANDRIRIQSEVKEPYLSAIMAMWGTTPTITEIVAS